MITTREFTFDQREFIRLHVRPFWTVQYRVLYGLTLAAWLVILLAGLAWGWVCGLLVVTSIPLWPLLATGVMVAVSLPENRPFFTQKRFYTIDEQQITVHTDDGQQQAIPFSHLARVVETDGAYLLYAVDGSLTYLPTHIFKSDADKAQFEAILNRQ